MFNYHFPPLTTSILCNAYSLTQTFLIVAYECIMSAHCTRAIRRVLKYIPFMLHHDTMYMIPDINKMGCKFITSTIPVHNHYYFQFPAGGMEITIKSSDSNYGFKLDFPLTYYIVARSIPYGI